MTTAKLPKISEKEFSKQVEQYAVKLMGWTVYHTWLSIRSAPGFPDLILVRPPRVLFVELKTDVGFMTTAQKMWMKLLTQCPGCEYYLWRPEHWKELERVLAR